MSSVPKSRRAETDIKFITALRELKALTIRKCIKMPKRYNSTVSDHLLRSVSAAKHLAFKANAYFPSTKMNVNARKQLFSEACAELAALASDVDDLIEMRDIFSVSVQDLDEWSEKILSIISMLQRVMESDEKRISSAS